MASSTGFGSPSPGGSSSSGSGGKSTGFGSSSPNGGGGKSTGRASGSGVPTNALINLAARLRATPFAQQGKIQSQLDKALAGLPTAQIQQVGAKAGLPDAAITRLTAVAGDAPKNPNESSVVLGSALDWLGRPGQAVQGAIADVQSNPLSGAWRGFSGQERFTPIQAFARASGETPQQAIKTEQGVNPALRFTGNLAGSILLDPTTYATFGTSGAAESAARSAAVDVAVERGLVSPEVGAKLAATGALSAHPATQAIFEDFAKRGVKALTKNDRAALTRAQVRGVHNLPGGARIMGRTIPGTPVVQSKIGDLAGVVQNKVGSGPAEEAFRPHGQMLAAERAGQLPKGTAKSVENVVSYGRGKALEGQLRQAEVRGATRITTRGSAAPEASLARVSNAIEKHLDPATLTKDERVLYDTLRRQKVEVFPEQQAAAHLQGTEQATTSMRDRILSQAETRIGPYERRTAILSKKAEDSQAALARLREIADKTPPGPARSDLFRHISGMADKAEADRVAAQSATSRVAKAYQLAQQKAASVTAIAPEEHVSRYLTPEGAAYLDKIGKSPTSSGVGGGVSGGLSSKLQARTFARDQATADLRIPEGEKNAGAPIFQNVAQAGERRIGEAYRDIGRSDVSSALQGMKTSEGKPLGITEGTPEYQAADRAFQEQKSNAEYQPVQFPVARTDENGITRSATETMYVHKAVAPDVAHLAQLYTTEGQKWATQALNYVEQLWKGFALTSTGFLAKKTEGELINGFWLTGANPRFLGPAARLGRQVAKGVKEGDAFKYVSDADKATFLQAVQGRALWSGFEKSDLAGGAKPYLDQLEKRGWGKVGQSVNPLSRDFLLTRGSRAAANWASNTARLGLFMALRAKGVGPAEAGATVRKYLFDYSELSAVDRGIKHVSPFFTWTRKNVPLQLETLAKQPGKLTAQAHVTEAARTVSAKHDPLAVPDWVNEGGGFVAPFKLGGQPAGVIPNTPLTSTVDSIDALRGILPAIKGEPGAQQKEATNIINALGVGGVIPGVGASAAQIAAGKQFFSGAPFKPGAQVPTPNWLGGSLSPFGKYMPAESVFTLQNLFPLSSKIQGIFPQYAPTSGASKKQAGANNRAKSATKAASLLSGATFAPINDKSKASNMYQRLEQLTALENYLKSQGAKVPTLAQLKGK